MTLKRREEAKNVWYSNEREVNTDQSNQNLSLFGVLHSKELQYLSKNSPTGFLSSPMSFPIQKNSRVCHCDDCVKIHKKHFIAHDSSSLT